MFDRGSSVQSLTTRAHPAAPSPRLRTKHLARRQPRPHTTRELSARQKKSSIEGGRVLVLILPTRFPQQRCTRICTWTYETTFFSSGPWMSPTPFTHGRCSSAYPRPYMDGTCGFVVTWFMVCVCLWYVCCGVCDLVILLEPYVDCGLKCHVALCSWYVTGWIWGGRGYDM